MYEGSPAVNPSNGRVSLVANGPSGLWLVQGNPDIRAALLPASLDGIVPRSAAALLSSTAPYDGSVVFDENGQPVFAYGDLHRTFVAVSGIKIAGGRVEVFEVVRGRRIQLRAGQSYLARPR